MLVRAQQRGGVWRPSLRLRHEQLRANRRLRERERRVRGRTDLPREWLLLHVDDQQLRVGDVWQLDR